MIKYFVKLSTSYQLEDGTYSKILTEPTEYYQDCSNQYEEIISRIKNKVVFSGKDVPYKDGYYDPHFEIRMVSQDYSFGDLRGYEKPLKGHVEIYLGKYENDI